MALTTRVIVNVYYTISYTTFYTFAHGPRIKEILPFSKFANNKKITIQFNWKAGIDMIWA
jgi:hypothetical protein